MMIESDCPCICANCKWYEVVFYTGYELSEDISGNCRRYPKSLSRTGNYWCGEFALASFPLFMLVEGNYQPHRKTPYFIHGECQKKTKYATATRADTDWCPLKEVEDD